MQQRQLRLGDILDDYCPRERRVTNHAVVAMVGADVKQTRCTTCDAEHEFKHAKVPRQRRKPETPAVLYSQVAAGGPKVVDHTPSHDDAPDPSAPTEQRQDAEELNEPAGAAASVEGAPAAAAGTAIASDEDEDGREEEHDAEQGPAHRRLIRATLPRPEGQPPPTRPAPEFTIRQPTGRQGRFRPRHQRESSPFHTSSNGHRPGNVGGGGMPRHGGGRPPMLSRSGKRHGPGGRKRSK